MKILFKQWLIRGLLSMLRGLVFFKRYSGPIFRAIVRPWGWMWRVGVRLGGVPSFRFVFWLRRHIDRLFLPTKHRLLFFVSNRFVIHAIIVLIGLFTIFVNIGEHSVRAESFGRESVFYSLVSETDVSVVEVVTVATRAVREPHAVSYTEDPSLNS